MKSKIVLVIAMLLLLGILLSSASFVFKAVEEYNKIQNEQKKQDILQNEQEEQPDEKEPVVLPPVIEPYRDARLYNSHSGVHEGYIWVETGEEYGYWQHADYCPLYYRGNGFWVPINTEDAWITYPVFTYSYRVYNSKDFALYSLNLEFYYQVCRNGVWEETLIPMDKGFYAYVYPRYINASDADFIWNPDKAHKVEGGVYSAPISESSKIHISVSFQPDEIDLNDITAVNFVMKVDANAALGWFHQFEKYY